MAGNDSSERPIELFYSYAHEDEDLRDELEMHLMALRRDKIIASWHDRKIPAGEEWEDEIDEHLQTADVILLLVSPHFMASDYCFNVEVRVALERHEAKEARVIPVILRPVDWQVSDLAELQALPTDAVAVTSSTWGSHDEAFLNVAMGIRKVVDELHVGRDTAPEREEPPTDDEKAEGQHEARQKSDPFADTDGPRLQPPATGQPETIGRYKVEKQLGEGAYGRVYLAFDDRLQRHIAIKVPHPDRVVDEDSVRLLLDEAQMAAKLEHPHVVPVYDADKLEGGQCYVASRYIEGENLANRIERGRLSYAQSAHLVAKIADALRHAHERGLFHRDIKPANILIGDDGEPYVADFGFALREEDIGKGGEHAGTPAYMSPEQARGEGHRVDGRSDIFSLGVVFYELLVGRRPFQSQKLRELLEQIKNAEFRPPRQIDANIPIELERICLRAMAGRIHDRYTTAKDLARDLLEFVEHNVSEGQGSTSGLGEIESDQMNRPLSGPDREQRELPSTTDDSLLQTMPLPPRVVPRGLAAFEQDDAGFFLGLLPGPHDLDGVPESINFWIRRFEERDPRNTFSVGILFGPSGCGKTSFVQAGVLPRLDPDVVSVVVKSVPHATAAVARERLKGCCPELPGNLTLTETLKAIRKGAGLPPEKKLLIVIDQFEQWLHARSEREDPQLVNALRQCDGERVQCLLMVRSDFFGGTSDLMEQLDIPIDEATNAAAIRPFSQRHARAVLAELGRGYECLPPLLDQMTESQLDFIQRAVSELAESDGKVLPVHLALFADMMGDGDRPWESKTLDDMGGARQVGERYLEEIFGAETALPTHRLHAEAAKRVLRQLLEPGTNIKGPSKSYHELYHVSQCKSSNDFDELLWILDGKRLITPTEDRKDRPRADSGNDVHEETGDKPEAGQFRYYQLTHDFLVPSLRDWLTRKQTETSRGRAEIRLDERAALWDANREIRQLPAPWEFANIGLLTSRQDWTKKQRRMMRAASIAHVVAFALLIVVGFAVRITWNRVYAGQLVEQLRAADMSQVLSLTQRIESYGQRTVSKLKRISRDENSDHAEKLRASLALVSSDDSHAEFLGQQLLEAPPDVLDVIRQRLADCRNAISDDSWYRVTEMMWSCLEQPAADEAIKPLRAACALARWDEPKKDADPAASRWTSEITEDIANRLVAQSPTELADWMGLLEPVQSRLNAPLANIFRDPLRTDTDRDSAAAVLARFAADDSEVLTSLLIDAAVRQFNIIFPAVERHRAEAISSLNKTIDAEYELGDGPAKQKANAAAALLRLGAAEGVWKLLAFDPDPDRPASQDASVRSYLIHRIKPLQVPIEPIAARLDQETDISIRRGLLLALGEHADLDEALLRDILPDIKTWYGTSPDPGVRAAARWLLIRYKRDSELQEMDGAINTENEQALSSRTASQKKRKWYRGIEGFTMVIVPGPIEFTMGSPITEKGRELTPDRDVERRHTRRIERTYAIASHEVTLRQFVEFNREHVYQTERALQFDCPAINVSWYQAAAYCNWLSEQEGIKRDQWCYDPDQEFDDGMKMRDNYLQRTGYRLPTEAEWEYACRVGTITSRFFGETTELLDNYAWYLFNSDDEGTQVIGQFKPNDLGLFDVYGNALEWCHDRFDFYPEKRGLHALLTRTITDQEDWRDIMDGIPKTQYRVQRGGGFSSVPEQLVRSASRDRSQAQYVGGSTLGFRVARTYPY